MGIVIIWIICAIAAGVLAGRKNRSGGGWFFLTLLLSPLCLLILACLAPIKSARETQCPACLGAVPKAASKCMHCGSDLVADPLGGADPIYLKALAAKAQREGTA